MLHCASQEKHFTFYLYTVDMGKKLTLELRIFSRLLRLAQEPNWKRI